MLNRRRFFYGALNAGSVNLAEAMPYQQALVWYDNNFGKARLRQTGTIRVHVITDSQVIASLGPRACQLATELPRKHIPVWAPLREYRQLGYDIRFHWAPRMTNQFNWAADVIAGLCSDQMKELGLLPADRNTAQAAAAAIATVDFVDATNHPVDIYDLHPQTESEQP
jgi:hypothetical protein